MSLEEGNEGLNELVALSEASTRHLQESRAEADGKAREAIGAIERKLVEALNGETLKGLPDLGDRVFGLRVDVEGSAFAKIPRDRSVLILDVHGHLGIARWCRNTIFVQVPPPAALVVASLLSPYLRVVSRAIGVHLVAAEKRTASFEKVTELASRLCASLESVVG